MFGDDSVELGRPRTRQVSEQALANVHTHAEKRAWYERMRDEAQRAAAKVPEAAPKKP